jgi:hypothetical protein
VLLETTARNSIKGGLRLGANPTVDAAIEEEAAEVPTKRSSMASSGRGFMAGGQRYDRIRS